MTRAKDAGVWRQPEHPYWTAPRDVWLLARTPTWRTYPCRCHGTCGSRCPCRGRVDGLAAMPSLCCARRAAETAARNERGGESA